MRFDGERSGDLRPYRIRFAARSMEDLRNHIPPRLVKDGPCKEVILTGEEREGFFKRISQK